MYRDQMLRAKDDEIEKLHGTIARLRSDSDRLRALLPKAFDAGEAFASCERDKWVANALEDLDKP